MGSRRDEHRIHLVVDHLLGCPKRRKPVLVGDVARDCRSLIEAECHDHGWTIEDLAIQPDHVHLFIRVWPMDSAADVLKAVQGVPAHAPRKRYPHLRKTPSLWTRSSFASTAGNVSQETIRRSIGAQKGMEMFKAFVFRLYPSASHRRRLEAVRETCRRFYNTLLRQRKDASELRGVSITKTEQLRLVKVEKDTSPYASGIHSPILQAVVADLDKAFQAFFRRVQAGEEPGYPRFKGRDRFAGFGFKEYGNGFKIDGRRLKLSGIDRIAVRWHRALEGTIKTARISCRAGKGFVSFACAVERPEPLPKTGKDIGVDVGLLRLATLSDGEPVENPRWYRTLLRELRVLGRKISRAVLGGRNRRKLVRRLQRLLAKVANSRKDFLNKFADTLIKRFDRIVLEDLRVAALACGRFALSILDAGRSYLVARLAHKAESAGREVVLVDPAYTSKTCSGCGTVFEHLSLSDRWISCACGVSLDRDHNAAINILRRGRNRPLGAKLLAGGVRPEAAPL
ncbi:MAG: IS200/IS605 family transposase [Planctomycetaceae bacterium]|nr:IS200/IS605 family transposase [Planctomycetaceae bacterium]